MRMTLRIIWIALVTMLIFSCSPDAGDQRGESEVSSGDLSTPSHPDHGLGIFPGFVVYGHEVRSFTPCGSNEALWAIEPSGLLWDLHSELTRSQDPYPRMFVLVEGREVPPPSEGFGADYPAALQIEKLLYAGVEGPSCNENWRSFHYRVHGNEPFWSAEVSGSRIRFSRMGRNDLLWHNITWENTDNGLRYVGMDSKMTPVEIAITWKPCRDSMSGSYYAFAAVLRMGDEELHGCALQGTD